jgi:predicted nicotinamide N-methyase
MNDNQDSESLADDERPPWQTLEQALIAKFDTVDEPIVVAGRTFQMLHPRSADDLVSEEDFDRDERLPYWAEVWPSSRVLAERLAGESGAGRRLLELGCGTGLAGIVASAAGFDVLATDYYAEALEFTVVNACRNGVPPPRTRLVDWRRWPDELGTFDWVVAGDVLYERPYAALVAEVFARTLATTGRGLMADPGRRPAEPFPDECRRRGLSIERIGDWQATNGPVRQDVEVYTITR